MKSTDVEMLNFQIEHLKGIIEDQNEYIETLENEFDALMEHDTKIIKAYEKLVKILKETRD